jgi:hypothetical protein
MWRSTLGTTQSHATLPDWRSWMVGETDGSREVTLFVQREQLRAELTGSFLKSGKVATAILEGGLEGERALGGFAEAAFGSMELDGEAVRQTPVALVEWRINPETSSVEVQLRAVIPLGPRTRQVTWRVAALPGLKKDELTVSHQGGRLVRFTPAPSLTSEEKTRVQLRPSDSAVTFEVEFTPLDQNALEPTKKFLASFGGLNRVPLLFDILKGFARALPFALVLLITRRAAGGAGEAKELIVGLRKLSAAFAFCIISLWVLTGFLNTLKPWGLLHATFQELEQWVRSHHPAVSLSSLLPLGLSCLFPALIGGVVPGFILGSVHEARSLPVPARRQWPGWLPSLLMALGAVLGGACVLAAVLSPNVPGWKSILVAMGNLSLIWVLVILLLQALGLQALRVRFALMTTVIIGFTAMWTAAQAHPGFSWHEMGWKILDALMGAALIFSLVVALFQLGTMGAKGTKTSLPFVAWVGIAAACGILAFPLAVPQWRFNEYDLLSLFVTFSPLFGWVWLAGSLLILWKLGGSSLEIEPLPRAIGLLAISTILLNLQSPAGGTSVSFMMGWLLLLVVVRQSSHWESLQRRVKVVVQERVALIQKILDLNALEHAYLAFRQKGREKLANGDMTLDTYRKSLQDIWQNLLAARTSAMVDDKTAKEAVFAFGPNPTAWANGVQGARYGLLFALPWILLAMGRVLNQPRSAELYPFWIFTQAVLSTVVSWALIGFLFGYFYPFIRGNNGLIKSAWIFVAVVTPLAAVAGTRISSADEKRALILWMAQVLIQVVLVGFSFDSATLRQSGFKGWRMVFEVHDLPIVSLSLTSLLVAVGAAVMTSLQSGASNLVGLALKLFIPSLPDSAAFQ